MYLSARAAFFRNLMVAIFNGGITLVILLIAPLGLAAVIMNTVLVMGSTLAVASLGDRVILFLQAGSSSGQNLSGSSVTDLRRRDNR
ncbi:MAG: hypothetical protein HC929_12915 [Leptolyngbyaceae cyanobacterium SM2_5_2]|nr:hypothetical protein [Leptolyngbyaceae cyanobacterium SM2_5_2]